MIPLPLLRPHRIAPESDLISLDHFPFVQQFESPILLQHYNPVRMKRLFRRSRRHHGAQSPSRKHPDAHARIIASPVPASATLDGVKLYGNETSNQAGTPSFSARVLRRQGGGPDVFPVPRMLMVFAIALQLCTSAHGLPWVIHSEPVRLLNGAPVLFQVKPPSKLETLKGTWLGHELTFSYSPKSKLWFALAGVSFDTQPGVYTLELTGGGAAMKSPLKFGRTFTVARAHYPEIKVELAVEKKFTEPNPEQQAQIAESVKVKQEYLARVTPDREWNGNFAAPVNAATSDVFGSRRIFNGVAQREHQGLDYRVPTGTPVAAMNEGTVLLARFLYFEGNCVVIDHGQGLLTLYFHLSELKVKEGDPVKRGQEIGLSGGTGRATGPHLHVAVRWQATYLDPARLLELPLP